MVFLAELYIVSEKILLMVFPGGMFATVSLIHDFVEQNEIEIYFLYPLIESKESTRENEKFQENKSSST